MLRRRKASSFSSFRCEGPFESVAAEKEPVAHRIREGRVPDGLVRVRRRTMRLRISSSEGICA